MSIWPEQHITEVADGIIAVLNGAGEAGVANAALVIEEGRVLVVDTLTFPEMAEGIVRDLTRRGLSASMVLNTHHHIDHVGGNSRFVDVPIIAHPASVEALAHMGLPVTFYDHLIPRFRGRFRDLELVPPQPALEQLTPPLGGELHVFTPAHTSADVTLWFPHSRVLITGDISFIGVTPLAVNGLISGWIEALDTLLLLQPEVVVPGHGRIGTARDLVVLRDYFAAIYRTGQLMVQENLSLRDAMMHFDAGPVTEWIEFDRTAINLERAVQEIRGEITRSDVSLHPPSSRRVDYLRR